MRRGWRRDGAPFEEPSDVVVDKCVKFFHECAALAGVRGEVRVEKANQGAVRAHWGGRMLPQREINGILGARAPAHCARKLKGLRPGLRILRITHKSVASRRAKGAVL